MYNLSKSYIKFDFIPPAGGANTLNWIHCNGFPFWQIIQLQPHRGMYLANIYKLNTYLNMVSRQDYKLQDYMTFNRPKVSTDAVGVYSGRFKGLAPTNTFATNPNSNIVRPDGTSLNYATTEAQYLFVGGAANTQTPVIHVKFQLDKIPHSIFSLDKNLVFNEKIYLNIT